MRRPPRADALAAVLVLLVTLLTSLARSGPDGASVLRDPSVPANAPFERPAPAAHVVTSSSAPRVVTTTTARPAPPASVPETSPVALYAGGTGKRIASVKFWLRLAHCETHTDWENPGRFSGGLGIYVGTWRQWGGRDFAPTPAQASIAEQIVVANRISTQGYRRPDGKLVEPVWFTGWGALPCAGRPELVALDDPRAHLPEHTELAAS